MSNPRYTKECVRFAPMLLAREGELEATEASARDQHLAGCARCRAEAADLAATDGLIREALLADAARRDFAPFVDAVVARVERDSAGRDRAAQARPGFWDALVGWVRHHRIAAVTGALAPAVAGIALIMYVASDRSAASQAGDVMVVAEGDPLVLQTADGPVVLLGDDDGGT